MSGPSLVTQGLNCLNFMDRVNLPLDVNRPLLP
jgi:hypothetical protein